MSHESRTTVESNLTTGAAIAPGPGFYVATAAILLTGLAMWGFLAAAGGRPEISAAVLWGVLTAFLGCLTWVAGLRLSGAATTKAFFGLLIGSILARMVVYGLVLALAALRGGVSLPALVVSLLGSHLAYQCAEVLSIHHAARPRKMTTAGRVAALVLVLSALPGVTVLAQDDDHGQTHPAAGDAVHGAEQPGENAEHGAADGAEHGDEHEFDVLHHIADGSELETPFGVVHLPTGWVVFGIDMAPTKHTIWMWIGTAVLLLFVFAARRSTGTVPRGLGNALESLVVFVRDEVATKNIGHHPERFTPYLCTLFFFILFCNLVGLVPYGQTATGNLNLTAALAFLSLLMIQGAGIRENGLFGHLKGLVPIPAGVPGWLLPVYIPIILVVELVGVFAKPIALALRLFANMTAGHVVILSLLGIIFILKTAFVAPASVAFALFIYCLEVFIGFVQAYIFTMLTALFIGLSQHPMH